MLIFGAIIATIGNIIILLYKFKQKLFKDAFLDLILLCLVFLVLKGSTDMLIIGIYSSFGLSIFLYFWSPFSVRRYT